MGAVTTARFELDSSCRLVDGGRIVLGGSPLTMFRTGSAGQRLVRQIAEGAALAPGHEPLTDRLLAAGAIHPVPGAGDGPTAADVTLVIPAYGARPERVAALAAATGAARTVVVDDASPTPFTPAPGVPVEVSRLAANGGPGAARQHGLSQVTTPYVAFLDADVTVEPGWLEALLPFFADPRVALVAPRVRAAPGRGLLGRFEQTRSPLDLGPTRARIRAGTRVSYVPAAALVCRVAALADVAGFDTDLRLGEDVDLVWRLDEAGWRCRYEPAATVWHDVRPGLASWVRQRVAYGSSAAPLAHRHPGALAPAQVSAWSAAAWALPVVGAPLAGVAVAAGSTAALVKKLPDMPSAGTEALRLAGLGHLHAGRTLAGAVTRVWWPVAALAALLSRRARRWVAAAALAPALADWWGARRTPGALDPVRYVALRLLDDAAYGAGVWQGVARTGVVEPLVPDLTSWPRPRRYDRRRSG